MMLSCPHVNSDGTRCQGEVEVVVDEVDDGDGVWMQSGIAAYVLPDEHDDKVCCSEGHVLTDAQIRKLEEAACEDYYNTEPPGLN